MNEYKRVEIILCSSFSSELEDQLIKLKVGNFQIIPHLHGKNFSDDPAEIFQNSLFFFSVEEKKLGATLKEIEPILQKSKAQCWISSIDRFC